MGYSKEQRVEIGCRIYHGKINKYEAAEIYGISSETAREYMRQYRNINHLPPKYGRPKGGGYKRKKTKAEPKTAGGKNIESMTKKELIEELIAARKTLDRIKEMFR